MITFLKCLLLASASIVLLALAWLAISTVQTERQITTSTSAQVAKLIKDADAVMVSTDAVVRTANGKYGLIGEATAAARESRKTIDVVQQTSIEERKRVVEFTDASTQAVRDLDGTIKQAGSAVAGMRADLDKLTGSADEALKPLAVDLARIGALTETLDGQVKSGGLAVNNVALELQAAIDDFDKLIADPNIGKIIANSADTSKHLAGAAETLDDVMLPFRKKANQIKAVILKLLGMVKIVYAF